jgi:hypothetical protein
MPEHEQRGEAPQPRREELGWLIEPPQAGDFQIQVGIGDEAELPEDFHDAVTHIIDALHGDPEDMSARATALCPDKGVCPDLSACKPPYNCGLNRCDPVAKGPCFTFITCKIKD